MPKARDVKVGLDENTRYLIPACDDELLRIFPLQPIPYYFGVIRMDIINPCNAHFIASSIYNNLKSINKS